MPSFRSEEVTASSATATVAVIVPMHRELASGTLASILRQASLSPGDLEELLGRPNDFTSSAALAATVHSVGRCPEGWLGVCGLKDPMLAHPERAGV